ncbi:MAG: RNA methyltransferase [Verrucomicrobiota bacterium]
MSGKFEPVIILVEPQLGENIGMCARAMLNCGLRHLRLVNPRDGWPQGSARAAAADADLVLDGAGVFLTLDEAIADCERVFATTARDRAIATPVLSASEAALSARENSERGERVAILFGPEASGLDREAIARADTLVRFPTNPEFPSLNLAQAVLLFGWEWNRGVVESSGGEEIPPEHRDHPVLRKSLEGFLGRLEVALERKGFFLTDSLKPHTLRQLRSLFSRSVPSESELQLLHGVLTALERGEAEIGKGEPPDPVV